METKRALINLEERPHIAIFGKTGSKKDYNAPGTSLLQLTLKRSQMYAVDGKGELRSVRIHLQRIRVRQKTSYALQIR